MRYFSILTLFLVSWSSFAQRVPQSSCSSIDIREVNPKISSSPALKAHFSTPRNQDSIGWCYAFTSADLMSAELGHPVSGLHVSAIYNRFMLNDQKLREEIERDRANNPAGFNFSQVYESGRVQMAIDQSVKNGWICSEKGLPFDKTKPNQIHDLVKALEGLKPIAMINQLDKETVCREISNILSPFILKSDEINQIADSLLKDNLNHTMSLFAENACTEHIKDIPPMNVKIVFKENDLDKFMKEVNFNIVKGRPQTVDYDVSHFTSYNGFHSSLIMGRRWNNGRCEYNIRNSWGKSCASYKAGIECNKEQGTYWVSDEDLFKASNNIRYISN